MISTFTTDLDNLCEVYSRIEKNGNDGADIMEFEAAYKDFVLRYRPNEDVITEFHEKFGAAIHQEATLDLLKLRLALISEESQELIRALHQTISYQECKQEIPKICWVDILDGMADLQVVLSGTSVAIKELQHFPEAFQRVHESNMSKLGEDGKPILRADGKILKGPHYFPPNLNDLVD